MKRIALIVIMFLLLVFIIGSLAYAFDFDAKIKKLQNENTQIDQMITQRNQEIARLTQRKLENIGAVKVLQEVKGEEKEIEVDEKTVEVEEKK